MCVCVYHILFIHLSICGHLGCFQVLAILNNYVVNKGCRYLFNLVISLPSNIYSEK